MSKATRAFFEALKTDQGNGSGLLAALKHGVQAVAPGLGDILHDVKAEMGRLGVQGQMELASALFNGNAFVPYGPGQYTPTPEESKGVHGQASQETEAHQEQQKECEGREM